MQAEAKVYLLYSRERMQSRHIIIILVAIVQTLARGRWEAGAVAALLRTEGWGAFGLRVGFFLSWKSL